MSTYKYSRWDETQDPIKDRNSAFDALAEEILEAGDVNDALRNLFQNGLQEGAREERTGIRPVGGLNDLRKRLEEHKRFLLERYNLDSIVDDLSRMAKDIIEAERKGIKRRLSDAWDHLNNAADFEREELADPMEILQQRAGKNLSRLDSLPESPSGTVRELRSYDFIDPQARQKFQDLIHDLSKQMTQNFFQGMKDAMENLSSEDMESLQNLVEGINQMLRDRASGEDPDFDGFMEAYGHHFDPDRPTSLDELVTRLSQNMSAMHSMLESMSDEMRQELTSMTQQAADPNMADALSELANNIYDVVSFDEMVQGYPFTGSEELTIDQAMNVMGDMQGIEDLDRKVQEAIRSGNLSNLDLDEVEEIAGEDARNELEEVQRMVQALEEAGYLRRNRDRFELGPLAVRQIAQNAMREIFAQMKKDRLGSHDSYLSGDWGDLSGATLPYESDKSFDINLQKSLFNTVIRQGTSLPLNMSYDDLEVNEREHLTQSATVLMLDQSRSMGMYGTYTSAKKVALALYWLITTKFPRDKFYVVGFSDYGMIIDGKDLPESTWNHWVAGTNMHHGLMLARQLLSRENVANKQVLMVTDGEPTVHMEGAQAFFSYPPSYRTLEQTLREVKRCTREGITINTFMLEANLLLTDFIDQMAKINKGRAFYTHPDQLGRYVLVDYLKSRRARV